jgi:hypothetical protein
MILSTPQPMKKVKRNHIKVRKRPGKQEGKGQEDNKKEVQKHKHNTERKKRTKTKKLTS